MKLIFIRHGEPDYNMDSLTENGKKEALLLAERVSKWEISEIYVSPMGRARETAAPSLERMGRSAIELPYLREFSYAIKDPVTGRTGVPWDFTASDWTGNENMFKLGDGFLEFPCIKENEDIRREYYNVIESFDALLKEYGYFRENKFYRNINAVKRRIARTVSDDNKIRDNSALKPNEKETTLVFFCHLGVTCLILSHLINVPFEVLTHGFFMPTTSITVLGSEERWDDEAYFRVQALGDCNHLLVKNHPISPAGYFTRPFQG